MTSDSDKTEQRAEPEGLLTQSRRGMLKLTGGGLGAMAAGGTLLGSATAETADGNCVQVDFVSGSTTLDLDSTNTYSGSGSHDLVAWQWGETVDNQAANGESGDRGSVTGDNSCSVSASSGPTLDFSDYTASVSYDVSGCSGGGTDILLVSYESPCNGNPSNPQWDPNNADQQDVFDSAFVFDAQDTTGTMIVDIPPLPNDVPQRSNAAGYIPLDASSLPAKNCITGNDVPTATAASGSPSVGSPSPGATGVSANTNDAFAFDASNNEGLTTEPLPVNGTTATIAAWYRFSSHQEYARVYEPGTGSTDGAWEVLFDENTNDLSFLPEGGGFSSPITLSPDTWYFVVTVLESSSDFRLTVYDESSQVNSVSATDGNRTGDTNKQLNLMTKVDGSASAPEATTGRMDEVYVFSTALSASEVQTLWNNSF